MSDQAEYLKETMSKNTDAVGTADEKSMRVIAVASGKGGVGKSNIAVNLALAYSEMKKRVLIFDADLGFANVNILFGIIPKYSLYHVINGSQKLKDVIISTKYEGVEFIPGLSGFGEASKLSNEERADILRQLSILSYIDVIIIDMPPGVDSNTASFLSLADDIVIVTAPEPTSLTDCYSFLKVISTEFTDIEGNFQVIVNRVQSVKEGKSVATRLMTLADKYLNMEVDYLGYIYDDPLVGKMVRNQTPFFASARNARASDCIKYLVNRLEKIEVVEKRSIQKVFGKLLK